MRKLLFLLFCFTTFFFSPSVAQKSLPHISVKNFNGRNIISWLNQYHRVAKSVYVQRSYDSLRDFSTIAVMLNPENIDNGYLDTKPPYKNNYYRIFIAFDGGAYVFSEVKKAEKTEPLTELTVGDSIALWALRPDTRPHNSSIYIGKENNVIIELPDAEIKRYSIKFFDEGDKPVFELTKLHEPYLTLEKVNFIHAGWYYYELYEKGKLLEKNKFYLPKDQGSQPLPNNEKGKKNR